MLESVMLVAAGFLAACLLALALAPAQWRRAIRLTERRIRAHMPLSMAEIQADKDRVRAEFALAQRRLEQTIERIRADNVALRARLSRAADAANEGASESVTGRAGGIELDVENEKLREELARVRRKAEDGARALAEAEERLGAHGRELEAARAAAREAMIRVDEQKVQIAALTTRLASDEQRLRHLDRSRRAPAAEAAPPEAPGPVASANDDLARAESELEATRSELAIVRADLANRMFQIEELTQKLAGRERSAEDVRRRLETYETLVSGGDPEVADRLAPLEAARDAALSARDSAEAEKARLGAEVEVLRRELADARERDRGETDLLRDRLAEIAAKVAYISTAIEGGDPVVEEILRDGRGSDGAGKTGAARAASLADRIRALRSRASN